MRGEVESSSMSNNNDRTNDFVDKNLNQDRRISIGLENGQELIEKGAKGQQQKESPKKDNGEDRRVSLVCRFLNILLISFRILAAMLARIQPDRQRK